MGNCQTVCPQNQRQSKLTATIFTQKKKKIDRTVLLSTEANREFIDKGRHFSTD